MWEEGEVESGRRVRWDGEEGEVGNGRRVSLSKSKNTGSCCAWF